MLTTLNMYASTTIQIFYTPPLLLFLSSSQVHPRDERRRFITGFTGSAGTALVSHSNAFLWTDGRYFEQAQAQLSTDWILMKAFTPGVPTIDSFVANASGVIGVDPKLVSIQQAKKLKESCKGKKIHFVWDNLIVKIPSFLLSLFFFVSCFYLGYDVA